MEKSDISEPLVSVIIPAYNVEGYIISTIKSILNQTYPNIEIIIVNDGSTDNTLLAIETQLKNPIIKLINQKNHGAAHARNIGFSIAKGHLIKFLDGDDLLNDDMIKEQVTSIGKNLKSIASAKWGRFYNDDINTFKLNPEDCWKSMSAIDWLCNSWKHTQSMTNPGIFLIPRTIVEKTGPWNERLSLLDDTEYFSRLAVVAKNVVFSSNSVVYYRSGLANNLSSIKTYGGYVSASIAFESVTKVILTERQDEEAKIICANIWQLFTYNIFPLYPDLLEKAELHLKVLPKPTIAFPCGGYTEFFKKLIGWKYTKILKNIFIKDS